jgi:putative toxin-antitoxin system antitoxin component (TIGR02293 family)
MSGTPGRSPADWSPPGEPRQRYVTPGGSLGLNALNVAETVEHLRRGLSYQKLVQFQHTSLLPLETIARAIQLPKRTLVRRKKERRLHADESERLLRLALLFEKAVNLFDGDRAAARAWLARPCKALGRQVPLIAAETELGARAVEDVIGRLEHGVFT